MAAMEPTNIDAYLVYADLLQTRGDPRGQLIAYHHALRLDPANKAALRGADELLNTHRQAWLGPAAKTKVRARFLAKKMLRFHDGNLHFIENGDRKDKDQIEGIIAENRPAQLAQQTVALYATASSIGADFGGAATPREIISALRTGVHASNNLGMQFFRISATASEADWKRSVAYLRLQDGTLSYAPPRGSP